MRFHFWSYELKRLYGGCENFIDLKRFYLYFDNKKENFKKNKWIFSESPKTPYGPVCQILAPNSKN